MHVPRGIDLKILGVCYRNNFETIALDVKVILGCLETSMFGSIGEYQ